VVPKEPDYGDLSGALFTSMGTAAHSAIQLFMTLGKPGADMWGSWKCRKCSKEWKNCFRPVPMCCSMPPEYVEVEFRVGPLTGHMDGVACYGRDKNGNGGRWIAYEYKTIGKEPTEPKRQHVLQVRHYSALLKINHNIDISERGHLKRTTFGPYSPKGSYQQTRDWIFRAIRGFKAATQVHRDPSNANIIALVKERPCMCKADHDDYIGRKYEFSNKDCPLLVHCSRGNKEIAIVVRGILRGG
jgi:hypothetical protein